MPIPTEDVENDVIKPLKSAQNFYIPTKTKVVVTDHEEINQKTQRSFTHFR